MSKKKHTQHTLRPRPLPQLLSFVIPMFNEEDVFPILQKRLIEFLDALPCASEVILVNDGSHDNTFSLMEAWAHKDERIKVIHFSRNFGHQIAVTAGLDFVKGEAIVIMDADLQDPPEVVIQMVERYKEGYDIAYGQRIDREGESKFKLLTAWIFYRVMKKFVHPDLPLDAGDFRLISKKCLQTLQKMRELHRFLRGMVAWVGFPQIAVPYSRNARAAGETKYPLSKMLKFAWTAAISFSPAPLRFSLGLGIAVALTGFAMGFYAVSRYLIFRFLHPDGFLYNPGWATLVTLICIIGGAILIGIGILGEYVGRIFEEIKSRPTYIISETINL